MADIKQSILGKPIADTANYLFADSGGTLRRVLLRKLLENEYPTAGFHNSIVRCKNLGTSVTSAQLEAISSGKFTDLYLGDYWVINGITWRIAGFNIFLNYGDTALTKNHIVVVPDAQEYSAKMNDTHTTTGGYYNSVMKQTNLATALANVRAAFGESHVLKFRNLLDNAVSGNDASGWAWYDSYIDLMTEEQVYGNRQWGQSSHNGYCSGTAYIQFPLFQLAPEFICKARNWIWLRTVFSSASFCCVDGGGHALYLGAANSCGVRPFSLIG